MTSAILLTAATSLIPLLGAGPTTRPYEQPREVMIVSSRDHSEQPALFHAPAQPANADDPAKPIPLLVSLHSWSTNYKQYGCLNDVIRGCRQRGWIFISPNFRGPNNRPEACASELAVQDVLDAVDYARKMAPVDERRIYLYGGSGGGHMSLVMAHRAPRLWAAVSAWVPITDLAEWHRFCKREGLGYAGMMEACCGGPPGSATIDRHYKQRSPIFHLPRAKSLAIDLNAGIHDGHGGASVPISHTLNAFSVLAQANGYPDRVLSDRDIRTMTQDELVPSHLAQESVDEVGREHKILFRRTAGPVRVTIFDGGHTTDPPAALEWLASQTRKSNPPTSRPGRK